MFKNISIIASALITSTQQIYIHSDGSAENNIWSVVVTGKGNLVQNNRKATVQGFTPLLHIKLFYLFSYKARVPNEMDSPCVYTSV